MPRVVHFEIHAGDPERAVNFYQTLFGWNFQKWEGPMPYWLITTGPDDQRGINGGLVQRQGKIDRAGGDCVRVHGRCRRCGCFNADCARERRSDCGAENADTGRGLVGLLQRHRRKHFRDVAGRPKRSLGYLL